jgi:hypothetical protein
MTVKDKAKGKQQPPSHRFCDGKECFLMTTQQSSSLSFLYNPPTQKSKKESFMKKLKIYLDTSVISYLHQDDAPDAMRDTLKLWQSIKQDEYETFYLKSQLLKSISVMSQKFQLF